MKHLSPDNVCFRDSQCPPTLSGSARAALHCTDLDAHYMRFRLGWINSQPQRAEFWFWCRVLEQELSELTGVCMFFQITYFLVACMTSIKPCRVVKDLHHWYYHRQLFHLKDSSKLQQKKENRPDLLFLVRCWLAVLCITGACGSPSEPQKYWTAVVKLRNGRLSNHCFRTVTDRNHSLKAFCSWLKCSAQCNAGELWESGYFLQKTKQNLKPL